MAKKKHAGIPNPCNSKLERSSTYRDKCTNPCKMATGKSPYKNQIHHILCEHAILDIQPAGDDDGKKLQFIKDCLCMAVWDINDPSNLIGLPLKSAYTRPGVNKPQNHCCHNVDHNTSDGYTNEVKGYLHRVVWNELIDQKKPHSVNVDNIVQALKDCTSLYTDILTARGLRNKGTELSYANRFTQPKWYAPFSMSLNPTPRSPGGRGMPKILKMLG